MSIVRQGFIKWCFTGARASLQISLATLLSEPQMFQYEVLLMVECESEFISVSKQRCTLPVCQCVCVILFPEHTDSYSRCNSTVVQAASWHLWHTHHSRSLTLIVHRWTFSEATAGPESVSSLWSLISIVMHVWWSPVSAGLQRSLCNLPVCSTAFNKFPSMPVA